MKRDLENHNEHLNERET